MIIFLGPTGSGKSTQGQLMAARHGWRWLSTGEVLRRTNDAEIKQRLLAGRMVPDEITNRLVAAEIAKSQTATEERKIILDGYPRSVAQAKVLSQHEFDRLGREPVDIVVDIKMTKAEILKRLALRGRMEDNPQVIESRLKLHDEQAKPLKDYYLGIGVPVVEIDGVGTVGVVHDRIESALEQHKITGTF
jgi:adenylate kinase